MNVKPHKDPPSEDVVCYAYWLGHQGVPSRPPCMDCTSHDDHYNDIAILELCLGRQLLTDKQRIICVVVN